MSNGSSAAVGVAALLLWLAWVGLTTWATPIGRTWPRD